MKFLKMFLFICIILLCTAIFRLSAQPKTESNSLSRQFTVKIVQLYQRITDTENEAELDRIVSDIHGAIRKYAHFSLYTILGLLCALALSMTLLRRHSAAAYIISFIFCVLFAMSDEYHQTFVQGRSGEIRDIFIDSAGALVGIFTVFAVNRLKNVLKQKKH